MRRLDSLLTSAHTGPLGTLPPSTRGPYRLVGLVLLVTLTALGLFALLTQPLQPAATAVPMTVLETQVPSRPVATLERIDLGARIANTGATPVEDVAIEMTVTDPAGSVVMRSRQTGISLDARDTRNVLWGWRVPGHAPEGAYTARVVVSDSNGGRLASSDSRPATFIVTAE